MEYVTPLAKEIGRAALAETRKQLFKANTPMGRAKAARAIQGAWNRSARKKAYMAKKRSYVGEEPGSDPAKTVQYRTDGYIGQNGNVLNGTELLQLPRIDNQFKLNQRLRDIVYLQGFKVCLTIDNITEPAAPIYFNVCLVSAKHKNTIGNGLDLFRSFASNKRAQDFTDGTLNTMDRHCLPLNSDGYVIHFHKRMVIKEFNGSSVTERNEAAKVWKYETYVPIKRQIRFENEQASSETKFWLHHWSNTARATIAASNTPITNQYRADVKVVTYFKEPIPKVSWR